MSGESDRLGAIGIKPDGFPFNYALVNEGIKKLHLFVKGDLKMAENYSLKSIFNSDPVREKGMFRFILEVGIFRFALPFTFLSRTVSYLLKYGWSFANIEELFTEPNIYYFFGKILTEGIIFGSIIWYWGKQEEYPKLNR